MVCNHLTGPQGRLVPSSVLGHSAILFLASAASTHAAPLPHDDFLAVAMCADCQVLVAPDSVVTPRALDTPLCSASTPLLSPRDAPRTYPMHI